MPRRQAVPVRIYSMLMGRIGWTLAYAMTLQPHLLSFFRSYASDFWFQLEKGLSTDLVHFQCYVHFSDKHRPEALVTLWASFLSVHGCRPVPFNSILPAYNEGAQLKKYCFKSDTRIAGPWAADPDRLAAAMRLQAAAAAKAAHEATMALTEKHFEGIDWRPWQNQLARHLLCNKPFDRKIIWYFDPHGAAGKSTFARYLAFKAPERVMYGGYGAAKDILFAIESFGKPSIIMLDLTRTAPSDLAVSELYSALESAKNGTFLSVKYSSRMHVQAPPHLVVFANHRPDLSALSGGRFEVHDLSAEPRPAPVSEEKMADAGEFKLADFGKPVVFPESFGALDTELFALADVAAAAAPAVPMALPAVAGSSDSVTYAAPIGPAPAPSPQAPLRTPSPTPPPTPLPIDSGDEDFPDAAGQPLYCLSCWEQFPGSASGFCKTCVQRSQVWQESRAAASAAGTAQEFFP